MDKLIKAAKEATAMARKSAKHAIEIAGMANKAARTASDHGFVADALTKASAALDEFHAANALHEESKCAAARGLHTDAVNAAVASIESGKNAAKLSHDTAVDAGNAGAPEKIVDLVRNHAIKAYNKH